MHMIIVPVLWPVLRLVFGRKITFDRATLDIVIRNRILLFRRNSCTHFTNVESVALSPRVMGAVAPNSGVGLIPIRVKDLSLLLNDGTTFKIATDYEEYTQLDALGQRLGELMGKPFVVNRGGAGENENTTA